MSAPEEALAGQAGSPYIVRVPELSLIVSPGPRPGTVRSAQGELLVVPAGWELLPPGDAGLTGRVKKAGASWTVQEKKGRKLFSRGVFAPADTIARIRAELELERSQPSYARKLESGRQKRAEVQVEYAHSFERAVEQFLAFAPLHRELGALLANAIAAHTVPVGSGTVARTTRIPIAQRVEAATIAWLRHATTEYDAMSIPRVKGMRREVRRMLADRSRQLLGRYRRGESVNALTCPLRKGLGQRAAQLSAPPPG